MEAAGMMQHTEDNQLNNKGIKAENISYQTGTTIAEKIFSIIIIINHN